MRPHRFVARAVVLVAAALAVMAIATAASAQEVLVTSSATHEGIATATSIEWRTTLRENSVAGDFTGEPLRIDLAAPLAHARIDLATASPPRAITRADGAIVAFEIAPAPGWRDAVIFTVVQPIDGADVILTPPLVAGHTPQVILVEGEDGRRFAPRTGSALVRHLGFLAPDDTDARARRACAEVARGLSLSLDVEPIYVDGTSRVAREQAIGGRITTRSERNRPGMIGAAVAFLAVLGALAAAYRRLGADAKIERAEAVLKEEFDRAITSGAGSPPGPRRPPWRG